MKALMEETLMEEKMMEEMEKKLEKKSMTKIEAQIYTVSDLLQELKPSRLFQDCLQTFQQKSS